MPNYITHQQAANTLPNASRILVVGCSGGGKSTLSQKISKTFLARRGLEWRKVALSR